MKTSIRTLIIGAIFLALAMAATTAVADPLPGQVAKFVQKPMVETLVEGRVYYGHDEESTVYNTAAFGGVPGQLEYPLYYKGNYVADDFADLSNMPVVHVQWWGSYLYNNPDYNIPVDKFLITFEKDVPLGDSTNLYDFSHPGEPILSQVVTRGELFQGSGTFTERSIHPGGYPLYEKLFEYNAELACPFEQEPDTVYWIKIAAMVDVDDFNDDGTVDLMDLELAPRWGWHNRDYTKPNPLASRPPAVFPGEDVVVILPDGTQVWHFQDDAVANGDQSGLEVWVNNPDVPCDVEVNQLLSQLPPYIPDYVPQSYLPGIDGPAEIGRYSKDLAFALYTIPEPSTIALIALGAVCLLATSRRRLH